MGDTSRQLRGLILSATELRQMNPEWTQAMVEDYLNILNNITLLADEVDTKQDKLRIIERVTTSPFQITNEDEIFADSDFGNLTILLPAGTAGRNIRIHNTGTSGNIVSVVPSGTESLFGVAGQEPLYDGEVFIITFEIAFGWD